MKGRLINCVTCRMTEIEVDYEIVDTGSDDPERSKVFKLIGGVTGYESFYLKEEYIQKIIKNGWYANTRTRNKYDGLHISAEEMKKAFVKLDCMVGD